jgi:hypothetical protein
MEPVRSTPWYLREPEGEEIVEEIEDDTKTRDILQRHEPVDTCTERVIGDTTKTHDIPRQHVPGGTQGLTIIKDATKKHYINVQARPLPHEYNNNNSCMWIPPLGLLAASSS